MSDPIHDDGTAQHHLDEDHLREDHLRLAEALIFAAAEPVSRKALAELLPDVMAIDPLLDALRQRYAGRGVELVDVAGGWQFRSAPDLAPRLRRVVQVPRRLPKAAMETLAVIAYHQPVTRAVVEEVRGVSLSQSVLDTLLEAGLIGPLGHKDVPGRPTLWGTTPMFLSRFGLNDLRDLPRREDLVLENAPAALPPAAIEEYAGETLQDQATDTALYEADTAHKEA